jgi:DNA-binding GntR family transcriptional regulator
VILAVFDSLQPLHLEKMKLLNRELRASIKNEDFQSYYQQNILFHDVFLEMSHNQALKRIIAPMKRRLYDFPRRGYIKEWELGNCRDHDRLIEAFETGDRDAAIHAWRDVHWSFEVQEKYIRRFYFPETPEPQDPKTLRRPSAARKGKHPRGFQRRPSGRKNG